MKIFNFKTWEDLIERFSGKIYCINDEKQEYLCDLEEQDLIKFLNNSKLNYNSGCDFYLNNNKYKQEILQEAIYINIRDEKRRFN